MGTKKKTANGETRLYVRVGRKRKTAIIHIMSMAQKDEWTIKNDSFE